MIATLAKRIVQLLIRRGLLEEDRDIAEDVGEIVGDVEESEPVRSLDRREVEGELGRRIAPFGCGRMGDEEFGAVGHVRPRRMGLPCLGLWANTAV